jgi:hypothetical protein
MVTCATVRVTAICSTESVRDVDAASGSVGAGSPCSTERIRDEDLPAAQKALMALSMLALSRPSLE